MTDEGKFIGLYDDRFEIIARARKHIVEATNIEMSPEEMKVLDNFLFRCWQMGWLKNDFHKLEKEIEELKAQIEKMKKDFSNALDSAYSNQALYELWKRWESTE